MTGAHVRWSCEAPWSAVSTCLQGVHGCPSRSSGHNQQCRKCGEGSHQGAHVRPCAVKALVPSSARHWGGVHLVPAHSTGTQGCTTTQGSQPQVTSRQTGGSSLRGVDVDGDGDAVVGDRVHGCLGAVGVQLPTHTHTYNERNTEDLPRSPAQVTWCDLQRPGPKTLLPPTNTLPRA